MTRVTSAESVVQTAISRMAGRLPQSITPTHRLVEDYLFDPLGLDALRDEVNAEFIRRGTPLSPELSPRDMCRVETVAELIDRVRGRDGPTAPVAT